MKTIKNEPIDIPNSSSKTINLYNYDQITKSKDSLINSEPELSICAWCQKLGSQLFKLHTDNNDAKILCSEVCFNQYRRASFKKNKDPKLSKIHQIIKTKSTNGLTIEKKTKSIINQDTNRRKIFSSYHNSTQTKSKSHLSSLSNEKSSSTFPINLTSLSLPPPSIDTNNHCQYSFLTPSSPPRQLPLSLPPRITSSEHSSSTLFQTLTKGLLSNYTCILPSFIPLPIPIPLCLPIHTSCVKSSIDVINRECQTEISNNSTINQRRMSF